MEYILPGTKGLTVECGGVEFTLMEDIKTEDDGVDHIQHTEILCFSAEVAPVCALKKECQYEARWSVMGKYALDRLKSGDISNPAWFDGIVAANSENDNIYFFAADGKMT